MKAEVTLSIALIIGIAIGTAGTEVIRAQQATTPPAYIIAEVEKDPNKTDDPAAMKKYVEEFPKTLAGFGGQTLVASAGSEVQTLEGDAPKGAIIVIGFASVEKACGWYNSPAYEALKPLRQNTRKSRLILVEGVAPKQ
jgi:uncharacterized protein (DUF1330 family)